MDFPELQRRENSADLQGRAAAMPHAEVEATDQRHERGRAAEGKGPDGPPLKSAWMPEPTPASFSSGLLLRSKRDTSKARWHLRICGPLQMVAQSWILPQSFNLNQMFDRNEHASFMRTLKINSAHSLS